MMRGSKTQCLRDECAGGFVFTRGVCVCVCVCVCVPAARWRTSGRENDPGAVGAAGVSGDRTPAGAEAGASGVEGVRW